MKHILLFTTILLLLSCKHQVTEHEIIVKNLSIEETLQLMLSEEYQQTLNIDEQGRKLLYDFYNNRQFKPLWSSKDSLNEVGSTLKDLLQKPIHFGLSKNRFDLNWSDSLALQNELVIVCGLARSFHDLKHGMSDSTLAVLKPYTYVAIESLDTLLDFSEKKYAEKIISWGPNDTSYVTLANFLFDFVQNNDLNEEKIDLKPYKTDSINAIKTATQLLFTKNYLDSTNLHDSLAFVKSLKKFQEHNWVNPTGKIDEETVQALTETNLHKAQRIALVLEKIRKKPNYPKRYFQINIPEYKLRLYNEDTLCSENNIVVGTFKNQTPELSSSLHTIVVYPFWNVPYSIASKEVLPALKTNVNYLAKNNMVLLRNKDTINPNKVNWSKIKKNTFPYKVVQQPGPKNSLGIVKFEFYNKYDVYFHDTPSKSYFKHVARTYSHGCMRTENPVELAKLVLELDENSVTPDSLDSLFLLPLKHHPIKLKKRIPVFIEYATVSLTPKSEVFLMRDIYYRDDEYIKALKL
ncbi:MAG: L,D-transpeptidase family protein [Crocinitomicaceae bacterium]|nr:L,D-transpeptidase family protein [Crocinitomicaceae bacterium]